MKRVILVKTSYRVIITSVVLCLSSVAYAQAPSTAKPEGSSTPSSEKLKQEVSSDWVYQCNRSKRCYVFNDGGTRIVFSKKRGKSNKTMRASVILPLGIAVRSPVTLHIGSQRNLMLNVTACTKKLCEAQIKEKYAMTLAEQLVGEPSIDVATSIAGVIAIESISLTGYAEQMAKM
jgi:invasion protein IalB